MKTVRWKISLKSNIQKVYQLIATDEGRASFWAESAEESKEYIHFVFPNDQQYNAKILSKDPPRFYKLEYFNSVVFFTLSEDKVGHTILELNNEQIPEAEYEDVLAGWVSVLMNLKAVADFGVDLRNHNKSKRWDNGFVDN